MYLYPPFGVKVHPPRDCVSADVFLQMYGGAMTE